MPPFQARVVKPRISVLHAAALERARRISADMAASVIGRPRIEPELSSKSVTTVRGNRMDFSRFHDRESEGDKIMRVSRPVSSNAFFEIELPTARLLRQESPLQTVGKAHDKPLRAPHLLIEHQAQARKLIGRA